jgi:limonene-1,2-epoxide hydrolase
VNDARVSSHHAQIRPEGQGYEIVDLGSSNGTFVNEQKLVPQAPRVLSVNDHIRVGDTTFVFEAETISSIEATVYGGGNPSFPPTVVAPPPSESYGMPQIYSAPQEAYVAPAPQPYPSNGYGVQQAAYAPPAPPAYTANGYGVQQGVYAPAAPAKKPSRRNLWIIVGAIIGLLVIGGAIAFGAISYVNRPTATKTLNAYCSALKGGDYHTAYNQLSSGMQAKYGSEAAFATAFSNNGGLGKVMNCTVQNANDGANTGTISYNLSGGSSLVVDYTLIDENSAVKINSQAPRSTPSLTLTTYCTAMAGQDYQSAYNQLSTNLQGQVGNESQFAAVATASQIKGCIVKSVNDAAGTGTITYVRSDGNSTSANATLVNQHGTWKIDALHSISTPTHTLLTYCSALKSQDYQTAYDQLSSAAQSQETEAQFAANFNGLTLTECKVSNVDDAAGTGEITYSIASGSLGTYDYTLVKENDAWKINSEKKH